MRFVPHPCAEFPNDNPELHDGATWVCSWTRARPRAVMAAQGVARRSAPPVAPEPVAELAVPEPPPVVPEPPQPELVVPEPVVEPALELPAHRVESDIEQYFASAEQLTLQPEPEAPVLEVIPAEPEPEVPVLAAPAPEPEEPPSALSDEDAVELETAFETYLGPEAHTPSEDLSVIISATMPPTVKRPLFTSQTPTLRAPEQLDWIARAAPGQLALDLRPALPRPTDAWAGLRRRPEPEPNDDVVLALMNLDAAFENDEYSPVPAEVAVAEAEAAAEVAVAEAVASDGDDDSDVAPTPVLPVARVEAPVTTESRPLPRPEANVEAEPASEEVIEAMAALDGLFDEEEAIEWQTPGVNLAVAPESGRFRVPRPSAFDAPEAESEAPPVVASDPVEPLLLELTPPPPGVNGWETLTDFVSGFLLARGQTRAAALCPSLLSGRKVELERLPEATRSALVASGIAKAAGDSCTVDGEFRKLAAGFHLDFMAGRAEASSFLPWLASVVGALLGHSLSPTAVRVHLEQAGIDKLVRSAA